MKHSSTWFALILIASALLPSAGSLALPSPTPTPNHPIQASEQRKLPEQPAAQYVASSTVTDLSPSPTNAPTPSGERTDSDNNSILAIGTFFFIALTGVATALIAKFNWQLVGVTDEMKHATAEAASAARDSAKAAELALYAERPYLLIKNARISEQTQLPLPTLLGGSNPPADRRQLKVTFPIQNYGKGVGIIKSVEVRLYVGNGVFSQTPPVFERLIRYCDERVRVERPVVGSNDHIPCETRQLYVNPSLLEEVERFLVSIVVVVRIRYRDVYGRPFSEVALYGYDRSRIPPLLQGESDLFEYLALIDKEHRKYLASIRRYQTRLARTQSG
jgi:hypothetical protein